MSEVSPIPSVTLQQFCSMVDKSPATVWRWISQGKAPASYKLGATRLFRASDIERWLDEQCRQPGAHA